MLASVCRCSSLRVVLTNQPYKYDVLRKMSRESWTRVKTRTTLKERLMAPAKGNAISMGRGAVAGGAVLGMGALCYYGLGLSNKAGVIETSIVWPQIVKDRISTAYTYLGGALVISAASAVMTLRSPALLRLVAGNGWMSMIGTFAAMIGTGILTQSIEYKPGLGAKQLSWLVHSAVMGAVIAPICLLGGPVVVRALWYTAGIVGGLSTIAVCAPSDKFLTMAAPLGMGLGVVFVSSIAGMFLSPATALGSGLYAISVYGGLLVFSGFMLYDTQKLIRQAETYPTYGYRPYDPVNASLAIYMDTLNIFVRMVMILSGGNGRRK